MRQNPEKGLKNAQKVVPIIDPSQPWPAGVVHCPIVARERPTLTSPLYFTPTLMHEARGIEFASDEVKLTCNKTRDQDYIMPQKRRLPDQRGRTKIRDQLIGQHSQNSREMDSPNTEQLLANASFQDLVIIASDLLRVRRDVLGPEKRGEILKWSYPSPSPSFFHASPTF